MSGEADSNAPCGKVIKLDKAAFKRLDLHNQLSKMVDNAGFTAQELEAIPATDLENEAFSSYSLAYLTWDKSDNLSRASVDKMIQKSVGSVMLSLSATEKPQVEAWTNKFTGMMLKAFELGRFDATRKPCPY